MNREKYADLIVKRMEEQKEALTAEFNLPGRIQSCILDDVLPKDLAVEIAGVFPKPEQMKLQKSIREHKYTAKQLDKFDKKIEEIVFAFQDPRILKVTSDVTGLKQLDPDPYLYAGGISLMANGNFLLPHLDNSHDKDRNEYRVLNLLYYITPGWKQEYGGNFELWDAGPDGKPREIVSAFNRLVIMATHETSWHSVNQVRVDMARCCISNYYFSKTPIDAHDYFHVTTFRGRPEQPALDMALKADGAIRSAVRKIFKKGVKEPDVFNKEKNQLNK